MSMKFSIAATILALALPASAQYSQPVRDVDNPARQPWTCTISNLVPGGIVANGFSCPTVPVGKRLVIEFVSVRLEGGTDFRVEALSVVAKTNGVWNVFYIPAIAVPGNSNRVNVSQLTRIYADAGSAVSGVIEGTVNPMIVLGAISGYLVTLQ